jgi:hypothetical protein
VLQDFLTAFQSVEKHHSTLYDDFSKVLQSLLSHSEVRTNPRKHLEELSTCDVNQYSKKPMPGLCILESVCDVTLFPGHLMYAILLLQLEIDSG